MPTRQLLRFSRVTSILASLLPGAPLALLAAPVPAPPPAVAQRLAEWQAARFGLFVHWGPVSLKGTEIGWSRGAPIPIDEYDNLYRRFNPTNFDADAWMQVARDAGMKYVVFTTKHHDGFCMWDTRQTDFNVMRSPFGRDVVKELSAAAKRHDLWFGTYHSVCDWHHPDFPLTSPGGTVRRATSDLDRYERYLRAQVSELITNYGPLHVMWFDVPQEFDARRGQGLIDLARSLQPDLIVNNRSGAPGDYDTPEQQVGQFQMNRPWETCMTICQQWAWKPDDPMKSLAECLHTLVRCAGGDGNLLFNVGPMPDGRIEPRQVARLREMGTWLAHHGESIYGTRGGPWKPTKTIASTRKGNTVYLHVLRWEGDTVRLPALPTRIVRSSLRTGGTAHVRANGPELLVTVLPWDRHEIDTVVQLDLDGPALEIPPIDVREVPGAIPRTASSPSGPAADATLQARAKEFLDWGFGMFLHFNLATFADVDWATGHEDPAIFQPAKLDCGQWADAAAAAGMKYGVLTVKHTEGLALWDSAPTAHDITACRNFKGGRGDVVREFAEAFRARGLKVGFYYCFPGDYSAGRLPPGKADLHGLAPEAQSDRVGFMKSQLTELLTRYGPVDLLWIDQYANHYTADR